MRMTRIGGLRFLAIVALLGGCTAVGFAQDDSKQTAPDNTKNNQKLSTTADQQSNNKPDLELAKNVRKAIEQDKSLSTKAHNVKVIAQNGQVTLMGPVNSDEEKQAVANKAAEVAGQGNVVDQLTVAPPKQ